MKVSFFAYKSDSDDYCRGCHMASYSSDLVSAINIDEDEAVSKIVPLMAHQLEPSESGYDIILMAATANGLVTCDPGSVVDIQRSAFEDEHCDENIIIQKRLNDLYDRCQHAALAIETERQRQAEQKRRADEAAKNASQKAEELRLLKRLQAKYINEAEL